MPTTKKTTKTTAKPRLDSVDVANLGGTKLRKAHKDMQELNEAITESIKKTGRPSSYTPELASRICARLSYGESLRRICQDADMPDGATVWRWLADKPDFREQYARAKEEAADALADDIQNIADKTLSGEYEPQASRVAIDAYKWTASKLKPKKYGDKLDLTSDGKQLPQPIISLNTQEKTDD